MADIKFENHTKEGPEKLDGEARTLWWTRNERQNDTQNRTSTMTRKQAHGTTPWMRHKTGKHRE